MNNIKECLICNLNTSKDFLVFEGKYWQVDTPLDIKLDGLFFIKTKRHVEQLGELTDEETNEIGGIIKSFSRESQKISNASKVIAMSLGFSEPHIHFWIIPVTDKTEKDLLKISKAVKEFADNYRLRSSKTP